MVVIWMNDGTGIDVFLQTGAEVFLASVVAYALKAGFENVFKIKQSKED